MQQLLPPLRGPPSQPRLPRSLLLEHLRHLLCRQHPSFLVLPRLLSPHAHLSSLRP